MVIPRRHHTDCIGLETWKPRITIEVNHKRKILRAEFEDGRVIRLEHGHLESSGTNSVVPVSLFKACVITSLRFSEAAHIPYMHAYGEVWARARFFY